jgi:hypothetical protein
MNSKKITTLLTSIGVISALAIGFSAVASAETEGGNSSGPTGAPRASMMGIRNGNGLRMMGSSTNPGRGVNGIGNRGRMGSTTWMMGSSTNPGGRSFGIRGQGRTGSSTGMMGSSTRRANQIQNRIDNGKVTGDKEIGNRIDDLNKLISRINSMTNVTPAQKTQYTSVIQNEISSLTTLESQVNTDNSTTSIRADLQSITGGNRVYALVIPKTQILASVDRLNTLVASLTTISSKLQTRISLATASGTDFTTAEAKISDLNLRLSDATAQGRTAQTSVVNLVPDNGNATVLASNNAALKAAREALKTAEQDMRTSRDDIKAILKALGIHS